MEKRFRRRTRDLVTQAASQGLSENEIGCARVSMMAKSINAPCKGRIQMRKTNPLHLKSNKSRLTDHEQAMQGASRGNCARRGIPRGNCAGAIIGSMLSSNGGQYMVWCDSRLGVAYRPRIATKASPNRTARPDLTELSNFAASLTWRV